jgi:hypothetical protein
MNIQVSEARGINTDHVALWEVVPAAPAGEEAAGREQLLNLRMTVPNCHGSYMITLRGEEMERFLQALPAYRPVLDNDEPDHDENLEGDFDEPYPESEFTTGCE